ncbi:hypothetical protein ACFQ0T_18895 [Kitasatospora gansuensis]
MAGNGYDNGEGAVDPRRGWAAAPGGQDAQQYPGGGPVGEPEYFTAPHPGYDPGAPGAPGAYDPDQPGHTRAFTVEDEQYYSSTPDYSAPRGRTTSRCTGPAASPPRTRAAPGWAGRNC